MSWLALDSKGDLARNYGTIAKECYGYNISVIDLRNPTRSDGNNLLTLVNRYMDIARKEPGESGGPRKSRKNTPRSCPRPLSTRTAMTATVGKTPSSTMPPKVCSPLSS